MNAFADIQTIKGPDGEPAFVVVPYHEFMRRFAQEDSLIPHTVVSATVGGASPIKAWREYLRLTQAEVAARMGVTRAAYAKIESAERPRKASIARVAAAFRITTDQLDF
jgi:DNA-binding XRE family transcriptional regulator